MKIRLLLLLVLLGSTLFGIQDFARLYSFDDSPELGFIVPLQGEGSYYYLQEGSFQQRDRKSVV